MDNIEKVEVAPPDAADPRLMVAVKALSTAIGHGISTALAFGGTKTYIHFPKLPLLPYWYVREAMATVDIKIKLFHEEEGYFIQVDFADMKLP